MTGGVILTTNSKVSLGASNTQATQSKFLPVVPNTRHVPPDAADISSTASYDLAADSVVLPPVPGTQSTASETSEMPPKGPGTSQTPRILLPKISDNNETVLASNVR